MFSSQRTDVGMCVLFGRKLILPVRVESGCTSHPSLRGAEIALLVLKFQMRVEEEQKHL